MWLRFLAGMLSLRKHPWAIIIGNIEIQSSEAGDATYLTTISGTFLKSASIVIGGHVP